MLPTTTQITVEVNGRNKTVNAYALSFAALYCKEQFAKFPIIGRVNITDGIGNLLSVNVEQSWGVNCSMTIKLDNAWERHGNPITFGGIEYSWSSTSRNLASASAAVALYSQMITIGAQLEAILQEWYYFYNDNQDK